MTKVTIVGEMYYSELGVGGGPIIPPGSPPGIWGPTDPRPTNPIAPGGPPLGFWGGAPPPYVDIGGPGAQPHPSHPIAPGGRPPGTWGGANEPFPTPPIFIPPGLPPVEPPTDDKVVEWHTAWTPDKGWMTVGIVTPEQPIPTPSGS
jgi:hypothetical protein